jgi:hypothetical protein
LSQYFIKLPILGGVQVDVKGRLRESVNSLSTRGAVKIPQRGGVPGWMAFLFGYKKTRRARTLRVVLSS